MLICRPGILAAIFDFFIFFNMDPLIILYLIEGYWFSDYTYQLDKTIDFTGKKNIAYSNKSLSDSNDRTKVFS